MTHHNLAELRDAVTEAARQAWTELRTTRPLESFYYFGLWTTGVVHRPAPTASSIEGLRHVTDGYQAKGSTRSEVDLRWSEADSPYDLFGDEYFGRVEEIFDATGDQTNGAPEPGRVDRRNTKRRFRPGLGRNAGCGQGAMVRRPPSVPDRGEIWHLQFDPSTGREMIGDHF